MASKLRLSDKKLFMFSKLFLEIFIIRNLTYSAPCYPCLSINYCGIKHLHSVLKLSQLFSFLQLCIITN